jgi:hypothetical protein
MERRKFIRNSALGLGSGLTLTSSSLAHSKDLIEEGKIDKLPGEVWIASFSLERFEAANYAEMVDQVLEEMEGIVNFKPDVICLPEIFPFFHISEKISIQDVAEGPDGEITSRFAAFAKKYGCYIICPLYTHEKGKYLANIEKYTVPRAKWGRVYLRDPWIRLFLKRTLGQ